MRVLLAPNAFKGSFSAVEVARIWQEALRDLPDVETIARPLSDGGDGALEVWESLAQAAAAGGTPDLVRIWFVARNPLGEPRRVPVLWDPRSEAGFVETALASGLALLPREARDPLAATTRGTGQLLMGLLVMGAREVTLGLGGSATCDGGLGLARELGYRFLDESGVEVERPGDLPRLARIVPPDERRWRAARIRALCDVRNPLLGPSGAARVFGPQKFAPGRPDLGEGVDRLERGLERLAERVRADLGIDLDGRPGRGAAGGLGAGLAAFAGAELESGSRHFLHAAGVPELLEGKGRVDVVLTGEGSYDAQSGEGKIAGELVELCRRAGIPLFVIAGRAPGAAEAGVLTGRAIGRDGRLDAAALGALAEFAVRRARASS
jgi:glycerate kinase